MRSRDDKENPRPSTTRGSLESPFLEEKICVRETEDESESYLVALQNESPFQRAFEPGQRITFPGAMAPGEHPRESGEVPYVGAESREFESAAFARRLEDAEQEQGSQYRAEESRYSPDVLEGGETSEPTIIQHEAVRDKLRNIRVIGGGNAPVTNGDYVFHQGNVSENGKLDAEGRAYFSKIDPSQPFLFEVRDRVCAIRAGAFFDPDDPRIEYGGTQFDWTLVRDDKKADKTFWPYYQQEMDTARKNINSRTVEKFLQHEHITRRPIRVAKSHLAQLNEVIIQATPAKVRVGPFVRYTDYERSVIWLETVTPNMVRVRYKKTGGNESSRYASTVRVGGRHFAAVEIDGLDKDEFYNYTVELAPLPATGPIPVEQGSFKDVFPALKATVAENMKAQMKDSSIYENEWLTFRTLRPHYGGKLNFATGSCRWFPGDKKSPKDEEALGPDMFDALGKWLQDNKDNKKEKWPHFQFFGGDQIYSDEIGDNHGLMMRFGRFSERIPGPADPAVSVRDKLIDGAWAGRFAHRFKPYKYPDEKLVTSVRNGLQKLSDIHERYPDIKGIYREYPEADPREKLKDRYQALKGKREIGGKKAEDLEEKKARESVQLLPLVDSLEISIEPFRAFLPHWNAGFGLAYRGNPMGLRYLSHNFLLWSIPEFEHLLPTVADGGGFTVARKPDNHGHPSAEGGNHAADFAEYAYLHERSWTSSRNVRVLLAQVPTFLMFDDHELTDDWNFDASWVRMIHNEKDALRMWPKTLTDGLAAYWVYQGWCNKAPSQWKRDDPRVKALEDAQRQGIDALPELRRCIHRACFTAVPKNPKDPNYLLESKRGFQTGLSLDWHYKLPFDPPFLVPDCRTRKLMVTADEDLGVIDHNDPKRPMSQTIDEEQLTWMREILVENARNPQSPAWRGPVAFIAPSTPLLMPKKVMDVMTRPGAVARGWAQGVDLVSAKAALFNSNAAGFASRKLIHLFRRSTDVEHMIRDRSWRDLWDLVAAMRAKGSPVKTLVLVSGDVHHNYCMTANLPGSGRPQPELLQITCSGLQTNIRAEFKTDLAEKWISTFHVGKYRLVPGFMYKNAPRSYPDLVLYQNAVALVNVTLSPDVRVQVNFLSGNETHTYRYTSSANYINKVTEEPTDSVWQEDPKHRRRLQFEEMVQAEDAEFTDDECADEEFAYADTELARVGGEATFIGAADYTEHETEEDEFTYHDAELSPLDGEGALIEIEGNSELEFDEIAYGEADSEAEATEPRIHPALEDIRELDIRERILGHNEQLEDEAWQEQFDSAAPAKLVQLDHWHVPLTPVPATGGFTSGSPATLLKADMNPGFVDSNDALITDTSANGLQTCMSKLVQVSGARFLAAKTSPSVNDRIRVSLVDLTGNKLSQPEFAGWGSTVPMYGASVPKILGLYAAFQVRSDVRRIADLGGISNGLALEKEAKAVWKAKKMPQFPDLVWLFDIRKWDSTTGPIDFTATAIATFKEIMHNCPAGTIIAKASLPFIGSLAWQSGLHHAQRGGLWLNASYCSKGSWSSPVRVPNSHNVTALSAATFFTLLAQGRLVDAASSADLKKFLGGGCVTGALPNTIPVVASKCGIWSEFVHDCVLADDGTVRYAAVVLSRLRTAADAAAYKKVWTELDALIRKNNLSPKPAC